MVLFTQETYVYPSGHGLFVNNLKYTRSGEYYGVLADSMRISIVKASTNESIYSYHTLPSDIQDFAFSNDDLKLAVATKSDITVLEVATGKVVNNIDIQQKDFRRVCFDPNNITIAAATADHKVYIFHDHQTVPQMCYHSFQLHDALITALKYFRYNNNILSTDINGKCVKWDSTLHVNFPRNKLFSPLFRNVTITHCAISPDDEYVLLTHLNDMLTSWKIDSYGDPFRDNIFLYKSYVGHEANSVNIMGNFWFTDKWRLVVCGSQNGQVFVWDFETAIVLFKIYSEGCPVITLFIEPVPQANRILLFHENGTISKWRYDVNE